MDGLPAGAVGPLFVYAKEVASPLTRSRSWPRVEVITYDLGTGRVAASFSVGTVGSYPTTLALAGRNVIVNYEHSMYSYALDGDQTGVLVEPPLDGPRQWIGDALVSPDGSLVALYQRRDGCDQICVVVIDVASGSVILSLPRTTPGLDDLGGGFPDPIAWRDDGAALLVAGQPNGHRYFGWATVLLDGSVQNHGLNDASVSPAPDGRHAVTVEDTALPWIATDIGCDLTTRLALHDLDANAQLAEFESPGAAVGESYWSPDGSALLLAWRSLPDGGSCGDDYEQWRQQPATWWLVDTANGFYAPIQDPAATFDNWYPTPRFGFACDGVELPPSVQRAHDCSSAPVQVVIEGNVIDQGTDVRYLGSIDVAPGNSSQ
jgi:hypothetical protein